MIGNPAPVADPAAMAESSVVPPSDVSDTQAAQSEADTQAALAGGTDGNASDTQTAVQTGAEGSPADGSPQAAASAAAAPQTPPPPPAPTEQQVRDKIAAEAREAERQRNLETAQQDLREFRRSAPVKARDLMDDLADALNTYIPPAARKPILDLFEEYGLKADRAAKLELSDSVSSVSGTLTEVSQAFYANLPADEGDDFSNAVRGKDGAQWVTEFAKRQQASGRADALVSFVEAGAAALSDEAKPGFVEAVSKAESMEDLAKALREAVLKEAETMPRGAPRGVAATATGARFRNLEQLNTAKLAGQLTDAEYLEQQNKLLGVAS